MQKTARWIAVNDRGLAIGESHPRAVLTDHDIGLLLELRDEGFSMAWLAAKFEVSKSCVAKIVWGQRRAQTPAGYRRAKPVVNDGVTQAAVNSKAALGPSNSGLVHCMDILHSTINRARPLAEMVQAKKGHWTCLACAERLARNLSGKTAKKRDRARAAKRKAYADGKAGGWWKS